MKAKREAELRALAKLEKDKEERGQADELAGAMYEFFAAVYDGTTSSPLEDLRTEPQEASLPFPSPDSIHVVTEFGVVEESAIQNTTIVSAGGPSPWHFEQSEDEEMHAEMTEDVDEQDDDLMSVSPPPSSTVPNIMSEHESEDAHDEGEEADIDTDDLDTADDEAGNAEVVGAPILIGNDVSSSEHVGCAAVH